MVLLGLEAVLLGEGLEELGAVAPVLGEEAGPLAAGVALLEVEPLEAELELPLVVGVVPEVAEEALVVVVPGAGVVPVVGLVPPEVAPVGVLLVVVVLPAPEEVSVGLEEAVLVVVVELLPELGELIPVLVPDEVVLEVWVPLEFVALIPVLVPDEEVLAIWAPPEPEFEELMPVFVPEAEVSEVWLALPLGVAPPPPVPPALPPLELEAAGLPLPPVVIVVTPEEVTTVVVVVVIVVVAAGLELPVTTLHSPGVVLVTPFSTNKQYGSPVASS